MLTQMQLAERKLLLFYIKIRKEFLRPLLHLLSQETTMYL